MLMENYEEQNNTFIEEENFTPRKIKSKKGLVALILGICSFLYSLLALISPLINPIDPTDFKRISETRKLGWSGLFAVGLSIIALILAVKVKTNYTGYKLSRIAKYLAIAGLILGILAVIFSNVEIASLYSR